ncbi:MAG TPA: endoribonuclease MazF [Aggregatilineales bacterium]|nr:endoribonuclease MazF [Aggregatilineales bacterium]
MAYVPDRGDLVWLTFNPQTGHEQAGRRPALTLSPLRYNQIVSLALFCPVTSQVKGYPFEVGLPPGLPVSGVVLADQVRNLDWNARQVTFIAKAPTTTIREVLGKLDTLLKP